MDQLTAYAAYAITLAIAAIIPGPGVAALVGQSLGGNARSGFSFLAGLALGDVTYLLFAIAGLSAIAQNFHMLLIAIKFGGGAYLCFLAYKFWTSDIETEKISKKKSSSLGASFLSGYLVTMGNPKTIIFYLAILPSVIDLENVSVKSAVIMTLITIVVLFAVLTPYVVLSVRARGFFTNADSLRKLNRVAAGFIGTAGIVVISEAVREVAKRT